MKVCILMLYTESWIKLSKIVIPNVQAYAKRHGYDTHLGMYKDVFSGFEKIKWAKISLNDYDVVWSLDMDTLITNHDIELESFLDDKHELYFTKDYNGLNCGSFIVKNELFSAKLLDIVLSMQWIPEMYCEQDAFNELFKLSPPDIFDKIKLLPHPSINSYKYELYPEIPPQTHEQGQWEKGDFVLHLPGIGLNQRIDIFNKIVL